MAAREEFIWAYKELGRKRNDLPALAELLDEVGRRIPRRKIITINAQGSDQSFGRHFNFMVGGNILGRGLTIDDLLVTYYLRQAQTTQMDTMLQHARMYRVSFPAHALHARVLAASTSRSFQNDSRQ